MARIPWPFSAVDPYVTRLACLLLFFAAGALVDLAIRGRRATRWREYASILLIGCAGALAGIACDAATSAISPDYFVYGKGLVRGATLTREAMLVGARAGFSVGCIVAGALWIANGPRDGVPALPAARIHRLSLVVLAHAAIVALLSGGIATIAQLPVPYVRWAGVLRLPQRFATVWWTHLGAYSGALLGVIVGVVLLRRERRARATADDRVAPP
jgi:hypothetical protein